MKKDRETKEISHKQTDNRVEHEITTVPNPVTEVFNTY